MPLQMIHNKVEIPGIEFAKDFTAYSLLVLELNDMLSGWHVPVPNADSFEVIINDISKAIKETCNNGKSKMLVGFDMDKTNIELNHILGVDSVAVMEKITMLSLKRLGILAHTFSKFGYTTIIKDSFLEISW